MRAFVTGASGFLGGALTKALLCRGDAVQAFGRRDMGALKALGASVFYGDLAELAAVSLASRGCDIAFHVGAKAGVWGPASDYRASNVDGTANVLHACLEHGIKRLVYTSTPSVVHAGADIAFADESLPYATHFDTAYPQTKAEAERMVLAANGAALSTLALRPHLIWGPGDNQLVPRLIDRAKKGRLVFPGDGKALIDSTFIDSAVEAHLLAGDNLRVGAACAGRAYFVSQGEPLEIQDLVNRILATAGLAPVKRTIPAGVAVAAGASLEFLWKLVGARGEPPLTRFVAKQMSTAHYFNLAAIRRDLGFGPKVSVAQGLDKLRAHFDSHPP